MKLFQHSSGTVVAFGFDMLKREPNQRMICWSDPASNCWEALATNQAGSVLVPKTIDDINPDFVVESAQGAVVAYQAALCIDMIYIGSPFVWNVRYMRPVQNAATVSRAA